MDDTVTISISEDERVFIEAEIASGRYATTSEVLRAGLAALEFSRSDATAGQEADAPGMLESRLSFGPADSPALVFPDNSYALQQQLEASANSGTSRRQIPEIMADVKAKLRANGSL